jgi:hypothetical protein
MGGNNHAAEKQRPQGAILRQQGLSTSERNFVLHMILKKQEIAES